MVENELNAKQFEGKGNQKDGIGRIARLNDIKSMAEEYPPRIQELPEKGAPVLHQVPDGGVPLFRHGMPIDM
jgi:hypothetical protein